MLNKNKLDTEREILHYLTNMQTLKQPNSQKQRVKYGGYQRQGEWRNWGNGKSTNLQIEDK